MLVGLHAKISKDIINRGEAFVRVFYTKYASQLAPLFFREVTR